MFILWIIWDAYKCQASSNNKKLALQFRIVCLTKIKEAHKDGNPDEFQHKEQLAPTETSAYMLYQNAKLHYGKTVSCPMGG